MALFCGFASPAVHDGAGDAEAGGQQQGDPEQNVAVVAGPGRIIQISGIRRELAFGGELHIGVGLAVRIRRVVIVIIRAGAPIVAGIGAQVRGTVQRGPIRGIAQRLGGHMTAGNRDILA